MKDMTLNLLVWRQKNANSSGEMVSYTVNGVSADMSFLEFDECLFDLVWCRHTLEHSVFPYFTLCEIYRFLKPGGVFYIEVPAPDTSSLHETNLNHYSVFTKKMWESLILRSGFKIVRPNTIAFRTGGGHDEYYAFDGRRE